jgi:hypothetical protein
MNDRHLQLGRVSLTIFNAGDLGEGAESAGGNPGRRAERIGKLTFDYLRELMERELQHLGADVTLAHLAVPPIQLSLEAMDDEAVARACAEGICRVLSAAI